jgi:O-antigen/teichoic acid export membrane protein
VLHLVAAPVTSLIFGTEYAAAAPALSRLALLIPMLALTILGGYVLGAAGRMLTVACLYATALAANVALNSTLVPMAGATGAALARLGSEALLIAGFLFALRAAGAAPRRRVVVTAAAVVAMGIAMGLVPDPSGGFLRACAFAVVVTASYAVTRVVSVAAVLDVLRRATLVEHVEAA